MPHGSMVGSELVATDISAWPRLRARLAQARPWKLAACIAVPLGLAYLIVAPPSADLAAASYRSYLFAHSGLTLWDNAWYGGHSLLSYSLVSPALGAPLGVQLPQTLAAVLAAILFALLIEDRFAGRLTSLAACWFALGVGIELLSGRVPFDIGLAIGLGALLAAQRGHQAMAMGLTGLCAATSPVAGAFLALATFTWTFAGSSGHAGSLHLRRIYASSSSRFIESRGRVGGTVGRSFRVSLTLCALAVIVALAVIFPESGSEPFAASSFWPAETIVMALAILLSRKQRLLCVGALFYGIALIGAFVIQTPLGGNAVRLGALVAGPLTLCTLGERRRLLVFLVPVLLYWQLIAPIRDVVSANSDPAVNASYYTPLLEHLQTLGALEHPARVEVVPTRDHWEARWIAPRISIARGWERQLDRANNSLFYVHGQLTAVRYQRWLAEQAISYVVLPDAPLDYSARAEARLVRAGLPYLREVWRSAHWRLFAVQGATPLAQRPAVLSSMGSDSFTLHVPRPGSYLVRVRFSPYWALQGRSGCVRQGPSGFTEVQARSTGDLTVGIDFTPARIFQHGERCR